MIEQYALPATLIAILLLSLSWHEAAHAWVADRLGDPTARSLGRVTLNPIRHMDPFLSVILPAMLWFAGLPILAGGKPVPINPSYFRRRARDFMLVALAGPGSNLLLALLCGIGFVVGVASGVWEGEEPAVIPQAARMGLTHVTEGPPSMLADVRALLSLDLPEQWSRLALVMGAALNVALAVFNLVPIPPLDGSRVIGWLLPSGLQTSWYRLDRFGILVVFLVIFYLGGVQIVLEVAATVLFSFAAVVDELAASLP